MDDQFFNFDTDGAGEIARPRQVDLSIAKDFDVHASFDTGDANGFARSQQIDLSTVSNFDVNGMEGLPALPNAPMRVRIPAVLHSLYDGPFTSCQVCDGELLNSMADYLILRSFKADEPITEYAICVECNDRLWSQVSGETQARIDEEFQRGVDLEWRRTLLLRGSNAFVFDPEPWIAECLLTGKPRSHCDVYQILAKCQGPYLMLWDMPWMRSGESLRRTRAMWSKPSRGVFDDFIEEHLGPTPGIAKETPLPAWV